jgi:hypothetical protein
LGQRRQGHGTGTICSLNIRASESYGAAFKEFCAKRGLTQTDGFDKVMEVAMLQYADAQDETLPIRKAIMDASQNIIDIVEGLQSQYRLSAKDLEHKRSRAKEALDSM